MDTRSIRRLAAALIACAGALMISAITLRAAPPVAMPLAALEWVRVSEGSFDRGCVPGDGQCDGDESPRHRVTLTRPFELMATEVTVGMYKAVMSHMDPQPAWSTSDDHPVVIVTWDEAQDFCRAVGGRLPSEAEWEYAARGGRAGNADGVFPWGNEPPTDRAGAADGAAFESDSARPVRAFGANPLGLYDMAGNVWEWVADWGGGYPGEPVTDPTGPASGRVKLLRGGSYGDDPRNLRASNRNANAPARANVNVGFRCAR